MAVLLLTVLDDLNRAHSITFPRERGEKGRIWRLVKAQNRGTYQNQILQYSLTS